MPKLTADDYTQKFSKIVKTNNLFYRFTRFCFRVNKDLKKYEDFFYTTAKDPKKGISAALDQTKNQLKETENKYKWLSRKLLGFRSLIQKIELLHEDILEDRLNSIKNNIPSPGRLEADSMTVIIQHLETKKEFVNKIKVRTPNKMPYSLCRYGINDQIHATAKTSYGKPMTYQNLKKEYDYNSVLIAQHQEELERVEKSRYFTYSTYHYDFNGVGSMELHIISNPSYELDRQRASDNLDACSTTRSYVKGWMKELSEFAPCVNIDEHGKPEVEYRYQSSLFRKARNESYTEVSVWETESEAKERNANKLKLGRF